MPAIRAPFGSILPSCAAAKSLCRIVVIEVPLHDCLPESGPLDKLSTSN